MITLFSVVSWTGCRSEPPAPRVSPLAVDTPVEVIAAALETAIPDLLDRDGVPGLSIALVRDAQIAWSRGFGRERLGGAPVTRETLFSVASNGKVVVALTALALVEDGTLSLDEPLGKYLKRPYLPNSPERDAVNLRRVLSHTSGMSNWVFSKDTSIGFPPGERFSYSGAGFSYLQHVLEVVSGEPLNELIRSRVFEPLGMRHSSFAPRPGVATGHIPLWIVAVLLGALAAIPAIAWVWIRARRGKATRLRVLVIAAVVLLIAITLFRQQPVPIPTRDMPVHAAYSLLSTADDLARLLIEIARPKTVLVSTIDAMRTPQIEVNDRVSWGLGIAIQRGDHSNALWHWGQNPGYESLMVLHPDPGIGVVILTNTTGGLSIVREIAQIAIGGEHYGYWEFEPR